SWRQAAQRTTRRRPRHRAQFRRVRAHRCPRGRARKTETASVPTDDADRHESVFQRDPRVLVPPEPEEVFQYRPTRREIEAARALIGWLIVDIIGRSAGLRCYVSEIRKRQQVAARDLCTAQ